MAKGYSISSPAPGGGLLPGPAWPGRDNDGNAAFLPPSALRPRPSLRAFTLVELLVSMVVLAIIMVLIIQLFNGTTAVINLRNKHMDTDAQVRALFDRMEVDFAQMVNRPDVDYFLKSSNADQYGQSGPLGTQPGNDQIAFYTQVPGYYPSTTGTAQQSPMSLVAYRVNSDSATPSPYLNDLQRLGDGLVWNGPATAGASPVVFSTGTMGPMCYPGPANAITTNWPSAITTTGTDANYELAGPQVFRMEYYYLIKASGTAYPSFLSDTPWDNRNPGPNHTSVNGLKDVAAIGMVIAVVDAKSRVLVTNAQLTQLAAQFVDFPATTSTGVNTTAPGYLETQWQSTLNSTTVIPHVVASVIRIYGRTFYLPTDSNPNL